MPQPIQKSATKNRVAAKSKIGSQKFYRSRFRNWQKDCCTADLEIGSQKLCRFQFKNWQPNRVAADSEIGSQKLYSCWFRIQQKDCGITNSKMDSLLSLCFAKYFRSLVILRMFWLQNGRWHHISQNQLDSWNSCICSTKMAKDPTMIFTSLVWIIPPRKRWLHEICRSRGNKFGIQQMLVDKLEWQRDVNLDKDIWAVDVTMRLDTQLKSPTWEPSSDSSLITVLESMVEPLILPIVIACSTLSTTLTILCQSSKVVVVAWGLLGTFWGR